VLVLGVDTSTSVVSVALLHEERVLARRDEPANNAHGEVLARLIDDVLRSAGKSAAELSALGVGLGPGPFTGLRVGIVTAAAMSDALSVPAYGDCSLDLIRAEPAPRGSFAVVTDARRRQVYWAVYADIGARIEGPDLAPAAEVAEHLRGRLRDVVGPGATQYAETFTGFVVADTRWPDAAQLASASARKLGSGAPADALLPMYLRRPDAREPGPPKPVTPP
jgi:tRNA threonylcarbamoyl adenosine modification protein YeaZ